MLLKASLILGLATAVPTEELGARKVDCKAVNLVVQALRISPGASKYCSNVLGIKSAQKTATVSTGRTVTITKVTQATVTQTATAIATTTTSICTSFCPKCIGRPFQFAEPTDIVQRREATAPVHTSAPSDGLEERAISCNGAPVGGFACALISSACGCLSLSTPDIVATTTKTSTSTATITSTAIAKTVFATTTTIKTVTSQFPPQDDPRNCGSCGYICPDETPFCNGRRCIKPCVAGQDFSSDPLNCGSCGSECVGSTFQCIRGECSFVDPAPQFTEKR